MKYAAMSILVLLLSGCAGDPVRQKARDLMYAIDRDARTCHWRYDPTCTADLKLNFCKITIDRIEWDYTCTNGHMVTHLGVLP